MTTNNDVPKAENTTEIGNIVNRQISYNSIGVVIIGRNEGDRLTNCLRSLQHTKTRMVYVDSGSTDGSQDNAAKLGADVVVLDPSLPFTAARARNIGFANLKKLQPNVKFIQFIDGDCTLDPDWMPAAHKFLIAQPDVAAVCGRRREINPGASIYNWLCDIEWSTPIGESQSCGGDAMFRAAPFDASGGYRESLIAGEEPELCIRLRSKGWKIWRIDREMTLHNAAIAKFSQWWRRCKRSGYGTIQVSRLHAQSRYQIWKRETARALIYGAVLPAALISGALYPPLLLAVAIYPLLIVRIAIRRGAQHLSSWKYALMMTVAKFAEFTGMVNFIINSMRRTQRSIIEYK